MELRTGSYGSFSLTDFSGTDWITYRASDGHTPTFNNARFTNSTSTDMYIRLDGLTIKHPTPDQMPPDDGRRHYDVAGDVFSASKANHLEVRNCTLKGFNKYISEHAVKLISCANVTYYHNELSHTVRGFMASNSPNFQCRYNYLHDTSEGSGIRLNGGCQGSVIEGNHVYKCTYSSTDAYYPANDNVDFHLGSGISIRSSGLHISKNIVHYGYSQGMMFYTDTGAAYSDMTIENNLFYDTGRVYLYNCGENVRVRNNTFIGAVRKDGTGKYDILQRHDVVAFGASIHQDHSGSGIELYNNIIASNWYLPDSALPYTEDYNTFWQRGYLGHGKGAHTIVAVWRTDDLVLHGYPNYFEDIGYRGSTPDYSYAASGVQPHFVNPGMYTYKGGDTRDSGQFWDYRLADGSPSINRGSATHQPSDSLGALGADGFVQEDGVPRDASHHSVGCYEYSGTVMPSNHAPAMISIGDKTIETGSTVTFSVAATDVDGDSLTYSTSTLPSGAAFSAQTFAWTPTANQVGSYEITFTVSDGQAQDSETVTIAVQEAGSSNTAPVLAAIGNKATDENQRLSFSIRATDADGDTMTYSASSLPTGASLSGQNFSWTPGYDQSGTHRATFTVSDGAAQDSETISISVAGVNQAPRLNSIGDRSVDEDDLLTFTVSASDPDGDRIAYSASGLPSGATLTGSSFSWTPTSSQVGAHNITFAASDGTLQDTEAVTLSVASTGPDVTAPTVSECAPEADAIQVPLNNLVTLHLIDTGKGVDADSVVIRVDDNIIFQGDGEVYDSDYGRCSRSGTKNNYRFIYQAEESLPFDHLLVVTVDAIDLEGNVMSRYSYSFTTEMRAFGNNAIVSGLSGGTGHKSQPATIGDAAGNIHAVWAAGAEGSRDIYAATMAAQASEFGPSVPLTTDGADHGNPDIALNGDGQLYVVWQDNRNGNWDIFASVSSDGVTWSQPIQVTDSEADQINPAIVVDSQSPDRALVVWQDNRNGNWDIYVASSTNAFVDSTIAQITAGNADQYDPDIAVDGSSIVYLVWTDMRHGQADIYGTSSEETGWANVAVVTTSSSQTSPAIAAEQDTSVIYLLWVDDAPGDDDIYYAWSNGLPAGALTGSAIIDDTSGADQGQPAITCLDDSKVFGCWQDWRHATGRNGDSDLFMADLEAGSAATNVLVGDDSANSGQGGPAIGIDGHGNPYIVWTDDRDATDEIYYAGTTFIDPIPLDSRLVEAAVGATIGPDPANIDEPEDVSIIIPAGACQSDVRITITKILNPQALPVECLGSYDFGPSGIEFNEPVTVTIPYDYTGDDNSAKPYWYDSLTGALSQIGITDIQNIVISDELSALQFKTTHFTPFYLVVDDAGDDASDGGGGGGCSVSATGGGSPKDLLIPYGIVALGMALLRRRDRERRKVSSRIES